MLQWVTATEARSRQRLMERLHSRWPGEDQAAFLDDHYLERLQHAAKNSRRAHFLTMTGRFVIGAAALAPTLTAAGAVATKGPQLWLKIIGIALGAVVAVATATMVAVRASPTWQTYYDLRCILEKIGWAAEANPACLWADFVAAVEGAITDHAKGYAAKVVDPSTTQPGV